MKNNILSFKQYLKGIQNPLNLLQEMSPGHVNRISYFINNRNLLGFDELFKSNELRRSEDLFLMPEELLKILNDNGYVFEQDTGLLYKEKEKDKPKKNKTTVGRVGNSLIKKITSIIEKQLLPHKSIINDNIKNKSKKSLTDLVFGSDINNKNPYEMTMWVRTSYKDDPKNIVKILDIISKNNFNDKIIVFLKKHNTENIVEYYNSTLKDSRVTSIDDIKSFINENILNSNIDNIYLTIGINVPNFIHSNFYSTIFSKISFLVDLTKMYDMTKEVENNITDEKFDKDLKTFNSFLNFFNDVNKIKTEIESLIILNSTKDFNMYSIIYSRAPIDILRMSDFKNIQSCHSAGGSYFQCAIEEAKANGVIAFILTKNEFSKIKDLQADEIFKDDDRSVPGVLPIARLRLRRLHDYRNKIDYAIPENNVYGSLPSEEFEIEFIEKVLNWATTNQKDLYDTPIDEIPNKIKNFRMYGGSYQDTDIHQLLKEFLSFNKDLSDDDKKELKTIFSRKVIPIHSEEGEELENYEYLMEEFQDMLDDFSGDYVEIIDSYLDPDDDGVRCELEVRVSISFDDLLESNVDNDNYEYTNKLKEALKYIRYQSLEFIHPIIKKIWKNINGFANIRNLRLGSFSINVEPSSKMIYLDATKVVYDTDALSYYLDTLGNIEDNILDLFNLIVDELLFKVYDLRHSKTIVFNMLKELKLKNFSVSLLREGILNLSLISNSTDDDYRNMQSKLDLGDVDNKKYLLLKTQLQNSKIGNAIITSSYSRGNSEYTYNIYDILPSKDFFKSWENTSNMLEVLRGRLSIENLYLTNIFITPYEEIINPRTDIEFELDDKIIKDTSLKQKLDSNIMINIRSKTLNETGREVASTVIPGKSWNNVLQFEFYLESIEMAYPINDLKSNDILRLVNMIKNIDNDFDSIVKNLSRKYQSIDFSVIDAPPKLGIVCSYDDSISVLEIHNMFLIGNKNFKRDIGYTLTTDNNDMLFKLNPDFINQVKNGITFYDKDGKELTDLSKSLNDRTIVNIIKLYKPLYSEYLNFKDSTEYSGSSYR